jgi:hypothetical protein
MYYYINNTTNNIYNNNNNYNTNYQLIAMGNSNASHNRLQTAPYSNAPPPPLPPSIINNPNVNMNNEGSNAATPYYATYHTLRQLVRPPSYHQTNENAYAMRNQQHPQAPHSQLPQLPLLVHQISNYPSESPQQQQQQHHNHQVHHHQQQHAFIQTMQKGSHLNYHKSERTINQDKHLDALVGLILPTTATTTAKNGSNANVTSKLYSSSNNSKENTLRKASSNTKSSANYSPKYQVNSLSSSKHKQQQQQEILLEKTNSSEYFFSNRDEKKKIPQRKNVLTCRSQETGANYDEINKGKFFFSTFTILVYLIRT